MFKWGVLDCIFQYVGILGQMLLKDIDENQLNPEWWNSRKVLAVGASYKLQCNFIGCQAVYVPRVTIVL